MTILETITGSATFSERSAKVQAFFVPTRDNGGSEMPLSSIVSANTSAFIRVAQKLGSVPAGQNMNPSVVGLFHTVNYEIPDGTVVKIFCTRSVLGNKYTGNAFIRMRVGAPFQVLKAKLTDYPKATVNEAIFRGRFDFLSPDEARALGARIPPEFERFYTRQAFTSVFTFEALAPEIEARKVMATKKIVNSSGEETVIQTVKPRRRLGV
jgi:hypothetical protein